MLADFREGVQRASAAPDVRVLVITGRGGSFCAGIDLADLDGRDAADRGGVPSESDMLLVGCAKPVIAAVDGPAVGMSAEFTCQADVRIASTRARFAGNFGQRGLVPDTGAGSWLLPKQIGLPAALRLLFTGEPLDAEEAFRIGYVSGLVEPDEPEGTATELAGRIAAASPFSARPISSSSTTGRHVLQRNTSRTREPPCRNASPPKTTRRAWRRRSGNADRRASPDAEPRAR
ncbi:enoyl-CoA hydratase/isomerase family protein [Saccharopolyspora rhizosphaerae]|uniref:enoyl-CoA hydratase/isomerase family protein n=1 Tax=Saccharopolyspora rhizosphaerae TaxID=2492662 RepID=UPI0018F2937F|nr:enoyl-CoA hydratase/isomerase family protein [Saccharopolyspora rhizosphaerae]